VEREATHRAIEAIWRVESARLIGAIARVVRDIGMTEELAQDALVLALEQWPRDGIPRTPAPGSPRRPDTARSISSAATRRSTGRPKVSSR